VTLAQLILDLPHRAAHGAEDFLSSGSCRHFLLGLRQHHFSGSRLPRVAKGRVQGGLWMLAKIAHATPSLNFWA
jgi:hypothetical protein